VGLSLLLFVLFGLLPRLLDPQVLGVDDFVEYWSAGRLNFTRGNPYAPDQLLALQKSAGLKDDQAIMMWNPPWALPLVMPFGLLDYPAGRLVWLLFHVVLVVGCADVLWRIYGGPESARLVAWLAALSFCPTLIVLRMGQISPFILLGLTGFLYFARTQHFALAGAFIVLAAIKPHLVYLVGLAVLLWCLDRRCWSLLFGAGAAGLAAVLIAIAANPAVFAQYRYATAHYPPVDWITTTFGTLLRVCFAPEQSWLQFVPPVFGIGWFLPYWRRHRRDWDWDAQLPLLLLVSYVTACFGWLGDQVALIVALIPVAVWAWRSPRPAVHVAALAIYLALDAADLALNVLSHEQQLWHLWTAPALLLGYLAMRRYAGRKAEPQRPAEADRPAVLREKGTAYA
jgi:hypothetical protein